MKLVILALATMGLFNSAAQAAMSGYYDSKSKIQVALDSPELASAMRQIPIESVSIENNGTVVVVQARGCGYAVHLHAEGPTWAGPNSYTVESVVGPLCTGAKN